MVAPLILAAGRAASAASKARKVAKATRASGKVRATEKGYNAYNARRRFTRAAEKYLEKAETATGETAQRYRELARVNLEDAISTYDPGTTQKFSKPIQRLTQEFGIDLEGQRSDWIMKETESKREKRLSKAIEKSFATQESTLAPEYGPVIPRSEYEAKQIVNAYGDRIFSGLRDVWVDVAGDKQAVTKRIFEYFNSNSWNDVLNKMEDYLESKGKSLYESDQNDDPYETIKLYIQSAVASNTLVA